MNSLIRKGLLILVSIALTFNCSVVGLETCDPNIPYSVYANDCGKFNWCVDGYKIVFPCAPGTLFDSDLLECEHSYLVDCGARPIQPIDTNDQFFPTAAPTSPALYPVQPTKPASTVSTGHTSGTTTPKPDFVPECTEEDDYTGVVDDCSKFLRCVNGRFVEFTCAPGTLFDSSNRICEHERLVSCLCGISQDECTLEDDFSPVKNDCSKFKRCDNGRFIELRCANGTLFDRKQKICDHDYLVDCSDRDEYQSTILTTLLTTRTSQGPYFTTQATTQYTTVGTTINWDWMTNTTPGWFTPMTTTEYEKPYVCGPEDDWIGVPDDCHKYKRCIDGALFLVTCPDGFMFDIIFKQCFNPDIDEAVCYMLSPDV